MFCPACWYYEKYNTKLQVRGPEEAHYRKHEKERRNDKETSNAERTTG